MTVNRDTFVVRDFNYDFESARKPGTDWAVSERAAFDLVPTHCCFCGVQCGMNIRVSEGRAVGVEPRDFVHNRGALCPKGVVAYQQADHPDRILHPLIRRGGKQGRLERATWDEALDYVTQRWQSLQAAHGRDSVAVYSGSSMTNEKCYAAGKFARVALGTRHVDYNGRLCMSSAAGAYTKAFGIDRSPLPIPDYALTDCVLAIGSNVAECFPIVMQWIWQARDRGARFIVVDPRETPAARTADLWLPIRPGTDVALLNCMLRQLIVDGLVDKDYISERTNGWAEVRAAVESYTPERVEPIVGIPAERIVAAARLYGHAPRSLVMHARGIEHSTHGVNNCLAAINLALARGQVGKPGGGVTMLTGQGNGQGGREMGQKAAQLPGYRHIDNPEDRRYIASVWGIDEADLPGEGASATEMVHLMASGEIKSCLVMCSNLMVSLPDNAVVKQALENLDTLVVVDFFMSETAELADVVLPGTVWLEDEGTTTNLEGRVIKLNIAQQPAGESKPDWQILTELARRLGKGRYFLFDTAADVWQELRRATAGGIADYSGITWERIEREQGVFWPCPSEDHPGSERLFAERFAHPDGRARFHALEYAPPAEEPNDAFPFRLTSGRVVYHYLSGNQTRRLGFLSEQAPTPWVEVHPRAAERLGIENGELVRVRTPRRQMTLKALVTPTIRPDTLFIPFHYGHEESVNQLTNPAVEPEVKIPEYKVSAAALERVDAPLPEDGGRARENETPASAPEKFPYTAGEYRRLTRSH